MVELQEVRSPFEEPEKMAGFVGITQDEKCACGSFNRAQLANQSVVDWISCNEVRKTARLSMDATLKHLLRVLPRTVQYQDTLLFGDGTVRWRESLLGERIQYYWMPAHLTRVSQQPN